MTSTQLDKMTRPARSKRRNDEIRARRADSNVSLCKCVAVLSLEYDVLHPDDAYVKKIRI